MKIVEQHKIEDCIDGSQIFQYHFDKSWTRTSIHALHALGKLDYFPNFPRPFFRLCGERGLQVKGVEGENNCQIFFPRAGKEILQKEIEEVIVPL
jgi:hypothetical protein